MSRLLYIQASPRTERSHSRAVADAFVQTYGETHPDDEIVTLDLFLADLPAFDGHAVEAKYKIFHGQPYTEEEQEAWRTVEALIERFKAADKYVLAVPMWNYGIPYRLKQYIDVLVQPGYTFSFSPEEGYKGLVADRPVFIAYASGGDFSEESGMQGFDFQKGYLDAILGFIGLTRIHTVTVQPTVLGGPDVAASQRETAIAKAREIAGTF